jgi:hypothetical protein
MDIAERRDMDVPESLASLNASMQALVEISTQIKALLWLIYGNQRPDETLSVLR